MLTILCDPKDVNQAQKEFREKFHIAGAKKIKVQVAHRGEVYKMQVTWLPSEGIWFGSRRLSNRFWNLFGVGKPSRRAPNGITCEINFPVRGINQRIAGLLAKDDNGHVRVFHRGKIRGKPGVGLTHFQNHFRGKWHLVEGQKLVSIGTISKSGFVPLVSRFVREVKRIKAVAP